MRSQMLPYQCSPHRWLTHLDPGSFRVTAVIKPNTVPHLQPEETTNVWPINRYPTYLAWYLVCQVPGYPPTTKRNNNKTNITNTNTNTNNKQSRSTHVYVTVPHDPAQLLSHLPLWMQPAATKRETGDTMEWDVSKLRTVVAATLLGCVMPTV